MTTQTFFTADTHWGHKNIIKYSERPFASVEEMDEVLINNWNSVVKPCDTVYHLGDVSFYKEPNKIASILKRLNGTKRLVRGNHDQDITGPARDCFEWVRDVAEIYVNDSEVIGNRQKIVLMHYAMRVWNKSHHGSWMLYGHSHGSLPQSNDSYSMDVGVDSNSYRPISYEQVKKIMKTRTFKPVDHHSNNR